MRNKSIHGNMKWNILEKKIGDKLGITITIVITLQIKIKNNWRSMISFRCFLFLLLYYFTIFALYIKKIKVGKLPKYPPHSRNF